MEKRKRNLSKVEIQYILDNWPEKTQREIAKYLNRNISTINEHVKNNFDDEFRKKVIQENMRRVQGISANKSKTNTDLNDKQINEVLKYSKKISIGELFEKMKDENNMPMSRAKFNVVTKEIGFIPYSMDPHNKRLFLDGNKENFDLDNILLVSKTIEKWLRNNDLIDLSYAPLLTAIKLAEYKTKMNKKARWLERT